MKYPLEIYIEWGMNYLSKWDIYSDIKFDMFDKSTEKLWFLKTYRSLDKSERTFFYINQIAKSINRIAEQTDSIDESFSQIESLVDSKSNKA